MNIDIVMFETNNTPMISTTCIKTLLTDNLDLGRQEKH